MALPLVASLRPAAQRPQRRPQHGHQQGRRPQLALVRGRRRVAWFAVSVSVLASRVMIGALLLHTLIAERQLELDRLEREVRLAQEEFDVLRSEPAQLGSPDRLAARAAELTVHP